jgi:hypothetical protein
VKKCSNKSYLNHIWRFSRGLSADEYITHLSRHQEAIFRKYKKMNMEGVMPIEGNKKDLKPIILKTNAGEMKNFSSLG